MAERWSALLHRQLQPSRHCGMLTLTKLFCTAFLYMRIIFGPVIFDSTVVSISWIEHPYAQGSVEKQIKDRQTRQSMIVFAKQHHHWLSIHILHLCQLSATKLTQSPLATTVSGTNYHNMSRLHRPFELSAVARRLTLSTVLFGGACEVIFVNFGRFNHFHYLLTYLLTYSFCFFRPALLLVISYFRFAIALTYHVLWPTLYGSHMFATCTASVILIGLFRPTQRL